MSEDAVVAPWYRQPWFWFLTIAPGATIIYGIFFIIVASNMEDSMVSDDYSKEGVGINLEIARDQAAYDLGIVAEVQAEARDISLTLSSDDGPKDEDYLIFNLYHPTLADRDQTIQLSSEGDGYYSGTLLKEVEGRWYYNLRGPSNKWRLNGQIRLPLEDSLVLRPEKPAKG